MANYSLSAHIDCFACKKNIPSKLMSGIISDSKPKISIVIPTYKRMELLKEAIDSVLNQQDFNDFEVVVGDNGTSYNEVSEVDELIATYNDERLFYYKHSENLGAMGNWNRLVELATGEYILMLHDDDWLEKDFLKKASLQLTCDKLVSYKLKIFNHGAKKTFFGRIVRFCKLVLSKNKFRLKPKNMIFNIPISNLSTFYKREKMIELGGYNEEYSYNADNMFLLRYVYNYGGVAFKKAYYNYRILDNDTISASKEFSKCGLIYRNEVIGQLFTNKMKKKMLNRSLYEYDISLSKVKRVWGHEGDDLLFDSQHRKSKLYKIKLSYYKFLSNIEKLRY